MTRRERAEHLGERFAILCEHILAANGYEIEISVVAEPRFRGDTVAQAPNGQRVVVETKLYRSARVSDSLIENAVQQLQLMKKEFRADKAVLITTLPGIPSVIFRRLRRDELELWDLGKLTGMAANSRELEAELAAFLRDAEIGSVGTEAPPDQIANLLVAAPGEEKLGASLISELSSIKRGRRHWRAFEGWCGRAITYLFGDQFGTIMTQRVVEGGYHRNDFIARIVPTHSFWISLASDFHTRYIVLEFKNYAAQISQLEILTTEKYLYLAALRSVAMIVCRSGFKKNAVRAAKGALRESGKLLLLLDIEDMKRMLVAKDTGDDPANCLFEILDETLTDIAP